MKTHEQWSPKNSSMTSFLKPPLIFLPECFGFLHVLQPWIISDSCFAIWPRIQHTFSSIVRLLLCYECKISPETFITYSQSEMEVTLENDGAEATCCHHTHRTVPTKGLLLWHSLWYELGTCISWYQWLVSSLMRNIFFEKKTNSAYLRDGQNFSLQNVSVS